MQYGFPASARSSQNRKARVPGSPIGQQHEPLRGASPAGTDVINGCFLSVAEAPASASQRSLCIFCERVARFSKGCGQVRPFLLHRFYADGFDVADELRQDFSRSVGRRNGCWGRQSAVRRTTWILRLFMILVFAAIGLASVNPDNVIESGGDQIGIDFGVFQSGPDFVTEAGNAGSRILRIIAVDDQNLRIRRRERTLNTPPSYR
jgi:hypothetical protein